MARSVSTPNDQVATLRNLKLLVVLLVVSNIAVGVLSMFLLRGVDQRYSDLINHSVPVLNDLQELTAKSVEAMRGTNPALYGGSAGQQSSVIQRGRAALEADRVLRHKLLKEEWLPATSEKRMEFQHMGDAFTKLGDEVMKLFEAGQLGEASRLREESMRPAFERYQRATTKAADLLLDESVMVNSNFSARTSRLTTIVLGVAGWPVLLLMGLLLLIVLFVIVMMVALRGKDMADVP